MVKITDVSCLNERGIKLFNCQSGWRDELSNGGTSWTSSRCRETHRAERDTDGDLKRKDLMIPLTAETGFKYATP